MLLGSIILDVRLIEQQQHLTRVYNESVYVQVVLCKREYESTKWILIHIAFKEQFLANNLFFYTDMYNVFTYGI